MPWPLIAAAAVGAGASIFGSISGAKAQEKAAEAQAKQVYSGRMEDMRKQQIQNASVAGTAVANAYASGLQMSGSPAQYIENLRNEQSQQLAYSRFAAKKERENILEGGQSVALGATIIGQAAGAISSFYTASAGTGTGAAPSTGGKT